MVCDICAEQQQQLLLNGDGSQVICDHDWDDHRVNETISDIKNTTIKKKRKTFISDEMFNAKIMKVQQTDTIKWAELPINVVYKIEKVKTVDTKFGERKIADLTSRTGKSYNVWLTTLVSKELESRDNGSDYYIKSLGMRNSTLNTDRKYYDFQILEM